MELISQDFCFRCNSLVHGRFIVDCNDMYPTGEIIEVKYVFPLKTDHLYLNFRSPEDTATWLKLKYGGALIERPAPKPVDSVFTQMKMIKKKAMYQNEWDNKKIYFDLETTWDKDIWNREYEQVKKDKKEKAYTDSLKEKAASITEDGMNALQEMINKMNRNNY